MADYSAISDIGNTLVKVLQENINSCGDFPTITPEKIALSSPDKNTDDIKLSIFLYRFEEDPYQKNARMQELSPDRVKFPPISLNLYYMITPNTNNDIIDYRLLGKIIQIFNDNPILRSPTLQGCLEKEELKITLASISIDEINKIWTLMSKSSSYRPSVYYEITPARIESTKQLHVERVLERITEKYFLEGN